MLSVKLFRIQVLLFILAFITQAGAQEDRIFRISYLTSDNGLSQNTVDCILKDSRGFMWFGTWNGLNRYDGYTFKVYKREDYEYSISNNFIHSLCEDLDGNLWVGTRNGLNLFDLDRERFINFYPDSLDPGSISGDWINVVYCDRDGTIWVGTNGMGLNRLLREPNSNEYQFEHFRAGDTGSPGLGNDVINSIYTDRKGRLWIGTNEGLSLYYPEKDSSCLFRNIPQDPTTLTSSEILCTFEDSNGSLWVGTRFGLNKWQEGTARFTRYFSNVADPSSLSHATITAMGEDAEGKLYIATLGGLDYYIRASDNFGHIPVEGQENQCLNNEFINSIFCDHSGLVWVGTEKGGINKFSIYQKQFRYFSKESPGSMRLNENTVNSILAEKNLLWVGTAGGGLNLINLETSKVTYFAFDARRANSIGSNFITSLCRDRFRNLWIGTWGAGFSKLLSSSGGGQFQYFQHDPGNSNSLINNFVSSFYEDPKGNLWIGTEGGLDRFDPVAGTFTHILHQPSLSEPVSEVGCILMDQSGNLWVGTRKGLFCVIAAELERIELDPDGLESRCFRNNPEEPTSLNENYVISLFEDKKGTIWVGTYGNGLNKLQWKDNDPETVSFIHYTQNQGLSNNVVYGILEDGSANLWLSTDYGLSRFNPVTEEFSNYFVADGLQSNQFYWSACEKDENGTLYFGGMKGVNYFNPDEIFNNTIEPVILLTDLKIFNNTIEPGKPYGKRIILEKAISETHVLNLSYKENTFSLEFSGLNYDLPQKNKYSYKLEGIDKDWINVGSNRRFASYTKLPGGEYTFYLKAANNDGLWNEKPLSLRIIIKPPFWRTGWFRTILVLFILLLIALYLRLHTRSLQLQKKKLEQQVRERTAQIENQKIRLEQQNTEILEQRDRLIQLNKKVTAANQLKLKFFTNISHEFRTPLTLILGPLEKLRNNWKVEGEAKQLLNLITRNAERLLHLINQLMDFRKIEKGKMDLHVQEGDLDAFIHDILEAFQEPVSQKHINLKYTGEDAIHSIWFDHEKLENMLFNLLSNALKYTPEQGSIHIRVRRSDHMKGEVQDARKTKGSQGFVRIEVEDSGIGISPEKLPNIFKRFYQAEQVNDGSMGSGIGLSLTKDLVKVHRGHIQVQSIVGQGTKFTLEFPCIREAFDEEEITQTKLNKSNLKSHVEMLKNILDAEREKSYQNEALYLQKHPGKPSLLIVEDNRELREFIASRLNTNYNILMAEHGEQAMKQAEESNPDLIISDIMMPVMDGLELCHHLKQQITTCHIPIILLTAKGTVENQIEGYKTGADDYIPKPFNLDLLETRVQNLIDSRKSLRALFSRADQFNLNDLSENPIDQKFLKDALEHIEENLDNTEFNVNDFASKMCVSRSLLHKKLTALTDQSATDFINTVRLRKSKEFMLNGSYNISEVAYAVGYNDPKYFSRLFKKHFGVSPTDYIRELRSRAV